MSRRYFHISTILSCSVVLSCSTTDPPQNLVISGIPNPCLHEAVELICSASGYPIPTYKWFNLTNGVVLSVGNTVIIESGGSYQCVATNIIRNVLYNASTSVYVSDCGRLRLNFCLYFFVTTSNYLFHL